MSVREFELVDGSFVWAVDVEREALRLAAEASSMGRRGDAGLLLAIAQYARSGGNLCPKEALDFLTAS